jgi:Prealbumin-like fold domain
VSIDLQNCGNVIIRKQTIPDEDPNVTEFGYTKSFNTSPVSSNTFTLMDDGVQDYENTVLFGTGYTVTEDVIPANWEFVSLDCSASSASTTFSILDETVTFDIDADTDVLDCTYTNRRLAGAIEITKTRKHAAAGSGDHPHAGVDFAITGNGVNQTVTTNAQGVACLDGLAFGDYTVTEQVPAGYVSDDAEKGVTVNATSTCGDGNEATVSFHNTPLTNLTVSVDSQVNGGTASTIDCVVASGGTDPNGDGSVSATDLQPGTYTCTIVIDP